MTESIVKFWNYIVPDFAYPVLKNPDYRSYGCSWSDWCPNNTLIFRCKFSRDETHGKVQAFDVRDSEA
jgi:hypothetical protein